MKTNKNKNCFMPEKQDPISRLELNTKTHFMTLNGLNEPNDNCLSELQDPKKTLSALSSTFILNEHTSPFYDTKWTL